MAADNNLDQDLLDVIPEDVYSLAPSFGLDLEGTFNELPIEEVVPPASIIPIPEGLPEFSLPTVPGIPNIPLPKLELPAISAPAIPDGLFSNLIPPAITSLFDNVKNDSGDPKVTQEISENLKSVVAFPVEPQAISKDIAKIAPQVSQDVLQDVVKNTLSLFMGIFVPGKAILDMILGIKDKAEALGLDKLLGFGQSLENKINELGSIENLNGALAQGLANSLNQASGLSDMRQVPVGPRNILSSTIPQHAVVSDKGNRADWPNGSNVEDDPLARLANSTKMAEDSHNIATNLSSLEKSAAVLGRSSSMVAQGLGNAALALQMDALMRAYSVNSVNVNGSLPSRAALLKNNRNEQVRKAVTTGGQVVSGKAKGAVNGSVSGLYSGQITDAAANGTVSGKGTGTVSGNLTAEITKAELVGGTVNEDGSISGGTLNVQALDAISVANATGTVEVSGTVVGSFTGGELAGSVAGSVTGTVVGSFSGNAEALGSTTPAVIRNTEVQGAVGTFSGTGTGALANGNGSATGAVEGSLEGSVSGASSGAGVVAVSTITNPIYGPTGRLEGGTVTGVVEGLAVTDAQVSGAFEGLVSGTTAGLQANASFVGQGTVELEAGSINGGVNLGAVPTSQEDLASTLNGLRDRANGAMPGNLIELAYGTAPLTPGYLQNLPGKVADKLGSPNGRLIDSYMSDANPDLDALTEILPELLLPGNDDIQQLVAALRAMQEIVIYLLGLPDATVDDLQFAVTQVGSDFVAFVHIVRNEAYLLGEPSKLTSNYLRRAYSYSQRQLVRKFASLWDNLQTDYTVVVKPELAAVAEKVMLTRKKVFNR